jgi:hypothetical protein
MKPPIMDKKLIIMAPPFGMGAIIRLTCVGIWLARCLHKRPVIWWGSACLYSKELRTNYYKAFFQPPDGFSAEGYDASLIPAAGSVYPDYWQAVVPLSLKAMDDQIPRSEDYPRLDWKYAELGRIQGADVCILHSPLSSREAWMIAGRDVAQFDEAAFDDQLDEIFHEYFRPSEAVLRRAEGLLTEFASAPGHKIGVHYRASDKIVEATIPSVRRHALTALRLGKRNETLDFFLATDCPQGLAELRCRLEPRGRVLVQIMDRTSSAVVPLHYRKESAYQNALDVSVDVELLSRCSSVCGNSGSGVFWWIKHRRRSLRVAGPIVNVEPGLADVFHSIFMFKKAFGLRRAAGIAPSRVREWVVSWLNRRGISRRRFRRMYQR